jgi:hypothetical protein
MEAFSYPVQWLRSLEESGVATDPLATLSSGHRRVAPYIMTTIEAMNLQTRDPLVRLPYETWLQCLSFATCDSADGPLPYLAVSAHWSETILSSPILWTQIIICNSEDEEARLHTFLHLSASLLVDVVCALDAPVQLLQLLAQNRMRIRSLVINYQRAHWSIPISDLHISLWSSLGNPNMRRLNFMPQESLGPIAHALIAACPNLRSLASPPVIEEAMVVATLEEVSASIRSLGDLGPLYKCTQLRSLSLTGEIRRWTPEPDVRNHFLQFSSHLGPNLVSLSIWLPLGEFIVFALYLPSFASLHSATFTIFIPSEELKSRIATSFSKQGILNLRVLSLYIFGSSGVESSHHDTVGHVLDYFSETQLLQHLQTFHCFLYGIPLKPLRMVSLLRCLSNSRDLELDIEPFEDEIGLKHPPIHMPNLLELSLRSMAWLTYIKAPNLLHLSCSEISPTIEETLPVLESFGINISHLVVDEAISKAISKAYAEGVGPRFEFLRIIKIVTSSPPEWVVCLSSIRIIDFADILTALTLNLFFLDLLQHPGALPNLSTIKTCVFPSWELLFEVLRRRNAAQVRPLEELVLPNFPVLAILSRVVKLLQGNTDVYTNRDFDEVIDKRRMDESLYVSE